MQTPPTVVITGAGRGIGFGIAGCFAERGARLAIADVDPDLAAKAAADLASRGAASAVGIGCDVTDRAGVEAALERAVEAFPDGIDVLVNNAGICPFVDGLEMSPAMWQKTLDVNLTGAFHCTQVFGRHMIDRGQGGRVVCITSLSENVTGPQQVDYAASKAGLRMMAVGFATSLARHGVTVNCVAPGMILTDMTRHHWEQPGPAEEIKQRVPCGRIGTPEDVGKAVVFLASPDAEYINGVTIRVDGGHQAVCV